MKNRKVVLSLLVAMLTILPLLAACKSGSDEERVVFKCDNCQVVELHETFMAGNVVGEAKPGDEGVVMDSRWGKLYGCMMYDVAVGDQRGWVCEDYLTFK